MQTDRERNLLSWGIVFGSIAGAVTAYFLAPKRGSETKKILANKLNHFTQKTIAKTQDALIDFEIAMEKKIAEDEKTYTKL